MLSLNGYPEDRAVMADVAELDPISAGYGMVAVLAALHARERTGQGQAIELAQGEAAFAGIAEAVIEHCWNGRDLGPVGNTHRVLAPHGMYPCRGDDNWIAIACADDEEWAALARCAGHEEWLARLEFATPASRREHRTALNQAISAFTRGEEKYELAQRLQAAGVAAMPVLTALEAIDDPHLMHRRSHMQRHEQFTGDQLLHGNAWHLSKSAPALRRPAAAIGQHNVEVLGEYLGMSEEDVRRMEDAGVLI
jgi:benzylsuccinate CoA-transferase BbsF subunit